MGAHRPQRRRVAQAVAATGGRDAGAPRPAAASSRTNRNLHALAHVCILVIVPGLLAWLSGRPFIFPSLGPSALALALDGGGNRPRQLIGGHLTGVVSGLLAYHLLAPGLDLAALAAPLSSAGLRIVASGVLSVALTTWLMLVTRTTHAPACATTLIVSLGVLPGFVDGAWIMAAVICMYLVHLSIALTRGAD